MSNVEKLAAAGLIAPDAGLSAEELAALEAMSAAEISSLVGARTQVREQGQDSPVPTFHVVL